MVREKFYLKLTGKERKLTGKLLEETGKGASPEFIAVSPASFVDYFRVRINPSQTGATDKLVLFNFLDGVSAGLHIRRAAAEFIATPDKHVRKPDIALMMSGETWARSLI